MSNLFMFCGRFCGGSELRHSDMDLKKAENESPIAMTEIRETEADKDENAIKVLTMSQSESNIRQSNNINEEFNLEREMSRANEGMNPFGRNIGKNIGNKPNIQALNGDNNRSVENIQNELNVESIRNSSGVNVCHFQIQPVESMEIASNDKRNMKVMVNPLNRIESITIEPTTAITTGKKKKKILKYKRQNKENINPNNNSNSNNPNSVSNSKIVKKPDEIFIQVFPDKPTLVAQRINDIDIQGSQKEEKLSVMTHPVSLNITPAYSRNTTLPSEVHFNSTIHIDKFSCAQCENIYRSVILNNTPHMITECEVCKNTINKTSLDYYISKYKDDIAFSKSRLFLYGFEKEKEISNEHINERIGNNREGDIKSFIKNKNIPEIEINLRPNDTDYSAGKKPLVYKRPPVHNYTRSSTIHDKLPNIRQDNIISVIDEILNSNKKEKELDENNQKHQKVSKEDRPILLTNSLFVDKNKFTFGRELKKSNTEVPKKRLNQLNKKFNVSDRLVYGMKEKIPPEEMKKVNKRLIQKLPELERKLSDETKKEDLIKRKETLKDFSKKLTESVIRKSNFNIKCKKKNSGKLCKK